MDKAQAQVVAPADEAIDDDEPMFSLVDLLTWLGEGKRVIGITVAGVAVAALIVSLLLTPIFTARTTLLPPSSQQQGGASAAALAALGSFGGLTGGLGMKTPDELYVGLLKSDSVQRELAKQFDLYARYDVKTYEALRKTFPRFVRVSADKKSGLITVEVDDEDPKFAADLANAYATEITKLLGRLAVSEAQQRRLFFDVRLKETKESLIKAEQTLRTVQEKSGMVALDQQSEAIIKAVAELKARIVEREVQLRVLRTAATAQNPDVQRLSSELAALRSELSRMESAVPPAGAASGIDIPIAGLPAAAVEYVRAMREVKFQETLLAGMLRQFEMARLDEAKEGPVLQQVDVAVPPDYKSKPSRAMIVLGGTMLALLLSSLYVIVRAYRRHMRELHPEQAQAWAQLAQAWRLRRPR